MRRFAAIPAHPQKQYTRRWRLYHFCGFYYPIREVIPIAIYHWNVGIVSRGKGKSAVAAAAYRSGEKLTNEWDGMTHDYTRKGGVVHTEIMLPPHAPPSFSDRSTLWNSVELYEKAGNAQLAREIDAALPIELSREEQIRLVREYCSSQFVSKGMCTDFALHDTDSGNPHCHIIAEYAKHDRAEFVRVVQEAQSSQQTAEVKKQRTRLATAKQRVSELEVLLCKIYEDNILGKLSDSRYATLDAQYEKEQSELTAEISALEKAMPSAELEKAVNERGISSRTMRTAKSRIGDRLVTEKDGTAWVCYLRD